MEETKRNRIFADQELAKNSSGLYECLYDKKVFKVAGSLENHLKKKYSMPMSHYLVDNGLVPSTNYIKCLECNMYVKVAISHIKLTHNLTKEEYLLKHPGVSLYSVDTLSTFSKNMSGTKNPRHTNNTTEQERKESSPNSIEFYKKRYPNLPDATYSEMLNKHITLALKDRVTATQLQYYVNQGLSVEDAKEKLSERQSTFSLAKCITKYGLEQGTQKHKERQIRWQDTLAENGNLKSGYSLVSQTLFYNILDTVPIEGRVNIYFEGKSKEYFITKVINGVKNYFKYDYTDRIRKKIIEFNGDIFHANPLKYGATDKPNPYKQNLTSADMWEYDAFKKAVAEESGFSFLTVWESEYKADKQAVIQKCIDFLSNP